MTVDYLRDMPSESTSLHRPRQSKKNLCMANSDGFTVISACFFVLSVTVTFALVAQIQYGGPEVTPHGAIATDDRTCSEIGMTIMRQGGSAVDVSIASLLCLSVTHPHLAGVGGGGVMMIHNHKSNESRIFDFMSAPPESSQSASKLGSTIGIPGFLRGLETVHKKYGQLLWSALVLPSVSLARNGFKVSAQLAREIEKQDAVTIRLMILPKGLGTSEGQILKREKYAELLEGVALHGADELYVLKYASEMLSALRSTGSLISMDDLRLYEVVERDALLTSIRNNTVTTAGLPFGGEQTIVGLHHLDGLIGAITPRKKVFDGLIKAMTLGTLWQQKSLEHVSNVSRSNEHSLENLPATQVVAVDAFDLYVSAVVGLGSNFGSKVISDHQIIFNNHLKNADILGLGPTARPLTPYTPLMVMNSEVICGQRLLLASGSASASLQVLTHFLFRGLDMFTAIAEPRLAMGKDATSLLVNDEDPSGQRLSGEIRNYLQNKNFTIGLLYTPLVVNGIFKIKDSIVSHSDTRGGGVAARLDGIPKDDKRTVVSSSVPSDVATLVT